MHRHDGEATVAPRELARSLLGWYRRARRDLPWRRTREPWAIWVSEVMLQQTRVATVREAWGRFLARFPDPASLAAADDDRLLTAWQGLGYYRRARLLREGARAVVREHGGRVPTDAAGFGALPGVGPYTRGAVLSIACDAPLPAIDGNVERVLARLLALPGDPKRRAGANVMRELIAGLHEHGRPGELNQALMELGATVCLPRRPDCAACPWRASCLARAQGDVARWPQTAPRPAPIDVVTEVAVAWWGHRLLARRIPDGEVNEGQLCLPGLGLPVPADTDLAAHLRAAHGLCGKIGAHLASVRHAITRYRIRVEAFAFTPATRRAGRGLLWADPGDPSLPWTTVTRKVLRALVRRRARPRPG